MTVDLVFLATMVGNIEHTVYLHTSRGNFPYQVILFLNDNSQGKRPSGRPFSDCLFTDASALVISVKIKV